MSRTLSGGGGGGLLDDFALKKLNCKRIVCDLCIKEWGARMRNKGENHRGSDDDGGGRLYDVKF